MVLAAEVFQAVINRGGFFQGLGCSDSIFPRMHEHHHLMAELNQLGYFLKSHPVEIPARLRGARFPLHTDEMLLQWDRSERGVEKEETNVARNTA